MDESAGSSSCFFVFFYTRRKKVESFVSTNLPSKSAGLLGCELHRDPDEAKADHTKLYQLQEADDELKPDVWEKRLMERSKSSLHACKRKNSDSRQSVL
jgi:hypothetical protein